TTGVSDAHKSLVSGTSVFIGVRFNHFPTLESYIFALSRQDHELLPLCVAVLARLVYRRFHPLRPSEHYRGALRDANAVGPRRTLLNLASVRCRGAACQNRHDPQNDTGTAHGRALLPCLSVGLNIDQQISWPKFWRMGRLRGWSSVTA